MVIDWRGLEKRNFASTISFCYSTRNSLVEAVQVWIRRYSWARTWSVDCRSSFFSSMVNFLNISLYCILYYPITYLYLCSLFSVHTHEICTYNFFNKKKLLVGHLFRVLLLVYIN